MRSAASIFLLLAAALPAAAQEFTVVSVNDVPTTGMAPGAAGHLILHLRFTDTNGNPKDYTLNNFKVTLSAPSLADPTKAYKMVQKVRLFDESAGWNVNGTFDAATDTVADTVQSPELASNTVTLDWNMGTFNSPQRAYRDCYVVLDIIANPDSVTGELTDNVAVDASYVVGSATFTDGGSGTPAVITYTPNPPNSTGTRPIAVAASTYAMSVPASAFTDFPFSITLTAQDAGGNRDKDYAAGKTANLSASVGAISPTTLTGFSNGVGSGSVQLDTAGSVTITASDSVTPTITAVSGAISVSAERTWEGDVSSVWSNAANWLPAAVPVDRPATINKVGGGFDPVLDTNADVTTLQIVAGNTLNLNGRTLRVSGAVTNEGAFTAPAGGTLILDGSGAQSFGGSGTTTVGTFQVGEGGALPTLTLSGTAGNLTATELLDVLSGAALDTTNKTLTVGGDLKAYGTVTLTGSAITMNGASAQTIFPGSNLFNALTVTNASASGVGIKTNGATEAASITFNGTVTIAAGARFNGTQDTITLKADWSQAATGVYVNTNSLVHFNSTTDDQNVGIGTFNNLQVTKGARKLTATGDVTVAGTLTLSSGTFDGGAGFTGHQVTGASSITGTLDLGTSTLQLIGPVTVNAGGRLTLVGAAILKLGAAGTAGSVTINSGSPHGRFQAFPSGASYPTVTSGDVAGPTFYSFVVNGEFEVTGMNFQYCDRYGLRLPNASDATVLNLSRITFDKGEKGVFQSVVAGFDWFDGVFLHITTNPPEVYTAGLISNNFGTPHGDDGNDRIINIKATENIGSTISMQMTASGGAGRGENFDKDDANDAGEEVTWINTTFWKGTTTEWDLAANWSDGVPTANLDAIIDTSQGATAWPVLAAADGPFICVSVTVGAGASLNLSDQNLTIKGTLTFDAASTFTAGTGTITLAGDGDQNVDTAGKPLWNLAIEQTIPGANVISLASDMDINGTATFTKGKLDLGNRTMYVAGNLDLTAANFTFQQNLPATVVFDTGSTATVQARTGQYFNHFRVNKPGGSLSAQSALDINGSVELQAGTFNPSPTPNTFTHTVGGNWTESGTAVFNPAAGTIRFDGTSGTQTVTTLGANSFLNLEISSSAGGVSPANNLTINGNLAITGSGKFNGGSRTYTIAGTWSRSAGGTFTPGTSTVNFTGAVTVPGETFYNLTVTGDVTASGALTIQNAFLLNGTRFRPSSGGANLVHTVQGNWTETAGTFTPAEGTIQFTGSAAQTLSALASNAFFNLTINKSSSTLNVASAGMNLDVNNNFTLTSGTFNSNGNLGTLKVGGAWSRSGTFTLGTSIVSFDGTADQSVPAETFYRLDVNKSTGIATATGALTVQNQLTVSAGTLNLGAGFTHNIDGSSGNVVDVTGTLDLGTSILRPDYDVLIRAGGVLAMNGTASARPQLQMAANRLLDVTGTLRTDKVDSTYRPLITSTSPGTDRYNFLISGFADVNGLVVESPQGTAGTHNGMKFAAGSDIIRINDLNFGSIAAGGTCLNALMQPASAKSFVIVEVRFPDDTTKTVARAATTNADFVIAGYTPKGGANDAPLRELDSAGVTNPGQIVWAGDNFWLGAATGGGNQNRWDRTQNWSLAHVPTSLENVIIESGKPAYPILSSDTSVPNILSLEVRGGSLTIDRVVTFTVGSNVSISGGTVTMTNGTLLVGGTWSRTSGAFSHTTAGTVTFNKSGGLLDSSDTFVNLTFSGTGSGVNLAAGSDTTVTGALTISGTLNAGTGTLRTGTWTKTGTFNSQTGTVILTATMTVPAENWYHLTVDGAAGTNASVPASASRAVAGNLTIGANDTLTMGALSSMVVGGNWTRNGTFVESTSTVTLNGGGLQQVSAANFYHLTVGNASASGVVSNGNLDINGNLTFGLGALFNGTGDVWNVAGNWDSGSGTYTSGAGSQVIFDGTSTVTPGTSIFRDVTATGTVTLSAASTWDIDGNLTSSTSFTMTSATVKLGGNLSQSGTWVSTGSTFIFDGTVAQTSNPASFNIVTITGTGTSVSITPDGTWDLAGALTVASGASLNASGDALQVAGDLTFAGTYTKSASSSLTLDGSVVQTVDVGSNALPSLTVSNTNGVTGAQFVDGDGSPSAATVNIDGNVTIPAGGRLNGTDDTISLIGNWSNSGTFVSTSSIVRFTGSGAQTISASAFNTLRVENTSGAATVSVTGNLTAVAVDVLDGTLALGTGLTHAFSGALAVGTTSGTTATLDLGTSTLTVSGDLTVRATGTLALTAAAGGAPTLRMAAATTIRVTGTINTLLSGANTPRITSTSVGVDRYGFEVTGTIELSGLEVESADASGLKVLSGATVQDIDDVAFLSPASPGVQLNLLFTSAYASTPPPFNFTGCTFQAVVGAPSSSNANVAVGTNGNAGVTVDITMLDSLGGGGTPVATAESMDVDDASAPGLVTVIWTARNKWRNAIGDNKWSTAGNWSETNVPDAADSPRWEVLIDPAFLVNPGGPTLDVAGACGGITINNLTVTEGAGGAFELKVAGDFTITGTGAFVPGDGKVTLDGAGVQSINPNGQSFNDLAVSSTAPDGTAVIFTTSVDVNGAFSLTDGQVNPNGQVHRFAGGWSETVAAGVYFRDLSGTVIFDGAGSATITPSSTSYFNHVQINKSLSSAQVTAGTSWLLQGNFDLTQGQFSTGGMTIELKGNWDDEDGAATTFTASNGTVKFSGVNQTLKTGATHYFRHLTVACSGTLSIDAASADPDLKTGNLTITSGTFNPGAFTVEVGGNWDDTGGTFTGGTGTVAFDGPTLCAQTITTGASNRFNHLTLNPGEAVVGTVTALSALNVDGNLTHQFGTFDPGSFTHTVAGAWDTSAAGASFVATAGRITFDGGSSTLKVKAADRFYDLSVNTSGTKSMAAGSAGLDVDRDFAVDGGTFDAGSLTHNVGRNYTSPGTLAPATSTFRFDGAAAQSIGAETFNGLTIANTSVSEKVTLASAVTAAVTTVSTGTLRIDGLQLTQTDNLTVAAGARLELNGAATVQVASGKAVSISGTLATTGSTPQITSPTPNTVFYSLTFNPGANLDIQGLFVRSARTTVTGDAGVDVAAVVIANDPAGAPDTVFSNLTDLQIQQLGASEPLPDPPRRAGVWIGTAPAARTINFTRATFDATCTVNVRSRDALDTVNMSTSGGVNQGESFDLDSDETSPTAVIRPNVSWLRNLTWTGAVDGNWNTGGNWNPNISPGSPDGSDVCTIPGSLATYPVLTAATGPNHLGFSVLVQNGASVTVNVGATLDLTGGLTVSASGAFTHTAGTVKVGGNFTVSGTYTHTAGTVEFDGTSPQTLTPGSTVFQTLAITNGSGAITAAGNLDVNGSVSIVAGGSLNITGRTMNLAGNLTGAGTLVGNATSLVVLDSGLAQTIIPFALGRVQISGTGTAVTVSPDGGTLDLIDMTVNSGTSLNIVGDRMEISGVLDISAGATFTQGAGSRVVFDGSGAQTVNGLAYNQLEINKGGSSTAVLGFNTSTSDAAVVVSLTAGKLDLNGYTLTVAGGLNSAAGSEMIMRGASRLLVAASKTVNLDGTFTASITGADKPEITRTGAGTWTCVIDGPFDVNGLKVSYYDASGVQITANASGSRFEDVDFTFAVGGGRHFSLVHPGPIAIDAPSCFFDSTFTLGVGVNVRGEDSNGTGGDVSILLEDRDDTENGTGRGEAYDADVTGGNVEWLKADTPLGGPVIGMVMAAYDLNTGAQIGVYVVARDAGPLGRDRVYVVNSVGEPDPLYDADPDTPGNQPYLEILSGEGDVVGPVWWNTEGAVQVLYFGTSGGQVYRVINNTATKKLTVAFQVGVGATITGPVISDGTYVYVPVTGGIVKTLNVADGSPASQVNTMGGDIVGMMELEDGGFNPFAPPGYTVYAGAGSMLVRIDGTALLPVQTAAAAGSVQASPIVTTERMAVGTLAGNLYRVTVNPFTIDSGWPYAASGPIRGSAFRDTFGGYPSGANASGLRIYVGDDTGRLHCVASAWPAPGPVAVDPDGAGVVPSYPLLLPDTSPCAAYPQYYSGVIYISNQNGKVFVVDESARAVIKTYFFGTGIKLGDIGWDNNALQYTVGGDNGRLYYFPDTPDPTP